MQAPTMTLSDLVFGPVCRDLDPVDRALQIDEHIARTAELEAELEGAKAELAEVIEERDDALRAKREAEREAEDDEGAKKALRALVDAIDGLSVARFQRSGKTKSARVGDLVIVAETESLADALGDALEAAKDVL